MNLPDLGYATSHKLIFRSALGLWASLSQSQSIEACDVLDVLLVKLLAAVCVMHVRLAHVSVHMAAHVSPYAWLVLDMQ